MMNKKRLPHIITVVSFVVFVVLGLASVTMPSPAPSGQSGSQTSNPYADTRWVFVGGNGSVTLTMTNNRFTFVIISSGGTTTYNDTGTYTYSGNNIRFLFSDGGVATATVIDNIMTLKLGTTETRLTKQTASGSQTANSPYADTRWVIVDGNDSLMLTMTNNGFTLVQISSGQANNATGTYTYSGNNIRFLPQNGNVITATVIDNIMTLGSGDNEVRLTKPDEDFQMDGTTLVKYYGFAANVTIPADVTAIGFQAFRSITSLTSVTIPSSVTTIGINAFRDCSSLTSITIPSSVTSIRSSTFQGCTGLTSITIPSSVTTIERQAFYGCTNLRSITIPSSVTSIGDTAFSGCTSLTSITIPSSVTSIGGQTFLGCTNLRSITIPSSVTSIGDRAFAGCISLTSITISRRTTIGNNAFPSTARITYSD